LKTTKKFHKDLQAFFDAFSGDYERIYYERRSKQYSHNLTIKQIQKINLRILTQYFVGMFLNRPEVSHKHESVLLKDFENLIFQDYHSKIAYFTVALAFYRLEELCRDEKISKENFPYKAHLLMMLREKVGGTAPNMNFETGVDEHSMKIINTISKKTEAEKLFIELSMVLEKSRKHWVEVLKRNQYGIKDVPEFTDLLLKDIRTRYAIKVSELSTDENYVYKGIVLNTRLDKFGNWYGYVKRPPENVFFHSNFNKRLNFEDLAGKLVSYKIQVNKTNGKTFATDVELLS